MCSSDSDCPWALSCDGSYCQDPCEGNAVEEDDLECGSNSECVGWRHRPLCRCMEGYERSLAGEGDGGCVEGDQDAEILLPEIYVTYHTKTFVLRRNIDISLFLCLIRVFPSGQNHLLTC